MITSNELELKSTLTLGTLESNAEAIRDLVLSKLEDYTPENYIGKAAEAKQDRAVLNNAEKMLNSRRLELERSYMEPFNRFKNTIKETCEAIKKASAGLDEIVKGEENRERAEKEAEIMAYWESTGFSLFPLEKVFDTKWTNKTAKFKDVQAEIDKIQKKTFDELKVLENFPAEDVPLLKTVYLDTLNIAEAMQRAEQLKANRDRLAREKVEREALEKQAQLKAQETEERQVIKEDIMRQDSDMDDLVGQALGLEVEQETGEKEETGALVFHGTHNSLLALKRYMTDNGITYEKLEAKGNGVYTITK